MFGFMYHDTSVVLTLKQPLLQDSFQLTVWSNHKPELLLITATYKEINLVSLSETYSSIFIAFTQKQSEVREKDHPLAVLVHCIIK